MSSIILSALEIFVGAIILGITLFPHIIRLSIRFRFTDKPNARKLHKKPVAVAGGIGILSIILLLSLLNADIRRFILQNKTISIAMVTLSITGMVDDKYNISAVLRLFIQLGCAFLVANAGIRITSLHGFLGIGNLSLLIQYATTIFVITAVTNAYNLLDGIDGWAGILATINIIGFAVISGLMHQYSWMVLLAAVAGALLSFLKYNWHPAKLFMGDCGSLLLGFLMAVSGIFLLQCATAGTATLWMKTNMPVVLSACFAIPVIDALRVFSGRIQRGKSPLSADKTHLHHKMIQHFLLHSSAVRKMTLLHLTIIATTLILRNWYSISTVIIIQLSFIVLYTKQLDFAQNFSRWYRYIKRMEDSGT